MNMRDRDLEDFDFEWECLNEKDGIECEYPFCQCESLMYSEYLKELPDIFEDEEIVDWINEDEDGFE